MIPVSLLPMKIIADLAIAAKDCGVADAFTTYTMPFTDPLNMSSVKDHITKPH